MTVHLKICLVCHYLLHIFVNFCNILLIRFKWPQAIIFNPLKLKFIPSSFWTGINFKLHPLGRNYFQKAQLHTCTKTVLMNVFIKLMASNFLVNNSFFYFWRGSLSTFYKVNIWVSGWLEVPNTFLRLSSMLVLVCFVCTEGIYQVSLFSHKHIYYHIYNMYMLWIHKLEMIISLSNVFLYTHVLLL